MRGRASGPRERPAETRRKPTAPRTRPETRERPAPRGEAPATRREPPRGVSAPAPRFTLPRIHSGQELLYGITPVERALSAGKRRARALYLKTGPVSSRLARILELAGAAGLAPAQLPSPALDEFCGSLQHQGVVLECAPLPAGDDAQALEAAARPGALLVVLDQVEDPQNLGAVVRNCATFGAGGLVVPRHHTAPFSPAASKASAGWLEDFPVYAVANLPRFLDLCRERRVWVAGTDAEAETALPGFRAPRPLLLVLGNEGKGMRPLVRAKCDYLVSIPTAAQGSLNIAAASAVLLYALTLPE